LPLTSGGLSQIWRVGTPCPASRKCFPSGICRFVVSKWGSVNVVETNYNERKQSNSPPHSFRLQISASFYSEI
jgi:hypothetical protein